MSPPPVEPLAFIWPVDGVRLGVWRSPPNSESNNAMEMKKAMGSSRKTE